MALTIPQLQTLIDTNLADNSNIIPAEHREVEHEIVNYLATVPGGSGSGGGVGGGQLFTKIVYLNSWQPDRQYTVATGIPTGTILWVHVDFECVNANNGFTAGDIIDTPRAYPEDSGRTAAQGVGVQYKAGTPSSIHFSTNDGVWAMSAWVGDGQVGGNFNIGANSGNWKIRFVITYQN